MAVVGDERAGVVEPVAPVPPNASVSGLQRLRLRHPLAAFVFRRVGAGILTLIVASFLIFLVLQVLPGNVAEVVLGRDATPQRVHEINASLHLNQSVVSRYFSFLGNFVTGHFGDSSAALAQGRHFSVWQEIHTPLFNSLVLALITVAIFVPVSLILATAAALRAGRVVDHAVSSIALALGALPEFLIGTLLIVIFFTNLGLLTPDSSIASGANPFSDPEKLILPILTLLCVSVAFGTRLLRASLIEVLDQDFVAMARLSGYRERRVILRHALRNAIAPSIQIVAQQTQYLIGGIIVVEAVFNYPGIGSVLVQAINVRDTQVITVTATLLAAIYIGINIVADLLVVLVVPKLRTQV